MVQVIKNRPVVQGSDLVIPAVPGEFYAYSSEFTCERPLYALMKCKANKSRPLASAEELGREINLLFSFGGWNQIQVRTVKAAFVLGLMGNVISDRSFGDMWIAPAGITAENFYDLRSRGDVEALVSICQIACSGHKTSIALEPEAVIAMITDEGKYGLFFVKQLAQESIQIDACHILL